MNFSDCASLRGLPRILHQRFASKPRKRKEFSTTNTTPPETWDVILADPPWPKMGGEKHYPTMSLAEIERMGDAIRAIASPNSWLLLWTTRSLENGAKAVMQAWSFEYHESILWGKLNHYSFGDPRYGVRRASEILLIGTKGNARADSRIQPDWFAAPVGLHSEKPHEQYAIVTRLAGPSARRLELFARHQEPGWDCWGDQVASSISLRDFGYPVPSDFTNRASSSEASE